MSFSRAMDLEPAAAAGLYIHIPFCLSKCRYCAFASVPCPATGPPAAYLEAVHDQARAMAEHPLLTGWRFQSLYIGGGTPTVYPGAELARLIETMQGLFAFAPRPEITVEANPKTIAKDDLAALAAAGVTRLSLGVQSFADAELKMLGRGHNRAEALAAVELIKASAIADLNLDLIYGLPGQRPAAWQESLATACALEPQHLSLYELTIEGDTPFSREQAAGRLALPEEEEVLAMEAITARLTAGHRFERYEISNYARPGHRSRHNINYWQNGPYLGLGAGAVSGLAGLRISTVREPERFIARVAEGRPPFRDIEALPVAARFRETVIMGLRMLDGIDLAAIEKRFGLSPLAYYGDTLKRLCDQGLVELHGQRLRLSPKGLPVANRVLAELV